MKIKKKERYELKTKKLTLPGPLVAAGYNFLPRNSLIIVERVCFEKKHIP